MSTYVVNGFKSDEDLIGYCELHCETQRALFNGAQINQMFILAGKESPNMAQDSWASMHYDMAELCKIARKRIREEATNA